MTSLVKEASQKGRDRSGIVTFLVLSGFDNPVILVPM
jgi:hypothetical protein